MNFTKILEGPNINHFTHVSQRVAVRAVIVENKQILLVHSNKGDYKFPGGGMEEFETHAEGLIREIREETGYLNCRVKQKIGTFIERKIDEHDNEGLFEMISHYYLCELTNDDKTNLQLDDYESLLEFTPKWVTFNEAISQNERLMSQIENNSWMKRETFVLREVQKHVD